jgi:hypothetical protein
MQGRTIRNGRRCAGPDPEDGVLIAHLLSVLAPGDLPAMVSLFADILKLDSEGDHLAADRLIDEARLALLGPASLGPARRSLARASR